MAQNALSLDDKELNQLLNQFDQELKLGVLDDKTLEQILVTFEQQLGLGALDDKTLEQILVKFEKTITKASMGDSRWKFMLKSSNMTLQVADLPFPNIEYMYIQCVTKKDISELFLRWHPDKIMQVLCNRLCKTELMSIMEAVNNNFNNLNKLRKSL